MCVGYLCGLHAGIPLCLKVFGGSGEHNSSEKSSVCAKRAFLRHDLPLCTDTYWMVVVVRQKVCGVPVWTRLRDTSVFEAVWR